MKPATLAATFALLTAACWLYAQEGFQKVPSPDQPASTIFVVSTADSMKDALPFLKQQLKDQLAKFPADLSFNMFAFGGAKTVSLNKGAMLTATEDNKNKAKAFLDGLASHGSSNPIAAIKQAIKLKAPRISIVLDGLDPEVKTDDLIKAFDQPKTDQPVQVLCIYLISDDENKPLHSALRTIVEKHGGTLRVMLKSDLK